MVAVDVMDAKLELAKDLGAEYVVNPRQQDPAAFIHKLGGADQAIPVSDVEAFDQKLDTAGVDHEIVIYPGAPHSFFDRRATCWQPQVKGLTIMVNSIFNGSRMEDVWLDR